MANQLVCSNKDNIDFCFHHLQTLYFASIIATDSLMSFLNLINKLDLQIETAARGAVWLRAEVFCSFAIPLDWSICTVSEG